MAGQFLRDLWICISMGFALLLPGVAWLAWLPLRKRGFAQSLATAFGISLAVTALGALATFYTGVYFSGIGLAIIYVIFALLALAGWLRRRWVWRFSWEGFITILLVGLAIAWRLYQASSLVLPAWVDSLQHVLIVQAILHRGGLSGDLTPYLPVPIYYHFGFHSVAAVYAFLAKLPADRAVLWIGQVLNAGVGLAVYRLGWAIWRDARRGLAAALLVSFFSTMPAYYVTWGRYTLLVGLILMALAMAEVVELIQRDGDDQQEEPAWRAAARLGLFTAGVLLSHYLAAILLALFMVLAGLYLAWRDVYPALLSQMKKSPTVKTIAKPNDIEAPVGSAGSTEGTPHRIKLWKGWLPLLAGSLGGALVAAPWIIRMLHYSAGSISLDMTLPVGLGGKGFSTDYANYLWYLAGPDHNHWLQLVSGLSLLYILINRLVNRKLHLGIPSLGEGVFAVWSVLAALVCLPVGLNLAPFHPHHMVMVIFFPVVLLAGHLLVSAGDALASTARRAWLGQFGIALAVALLCIWGIRETRGIINSVTILADQSDKQALDWISANLPVQARFFVNATPWQGSVYRGVDGGYWIMPYTGRQTLIPPISYAWGAHDYTHQINGWAATASQVKTCDAGFWQLMADANLSYVYLKQGIGSLQPDGLKDCSRLAVVYQKQGIWIYQVNP